MNTNEFYKQLMSEYTFDDEKIKKAAMGQDVPAPKKRLRMVIGGLSTAAAAAAVVIGISAIVGQGNPVSVTPSGPYSEQQRFELAAEAYEKAEEENTEEEYLYVTFKNSESADDMQDILLSVNSEGTIKVISLYLNDKSAVTGKDNIQAMFGSDEENIDAVKIMCPGNLYRKLQDNEYIYLVEKGDTFPEDDFTVLNTEYVYDLPEPTYPEPSHDHVSDPAVGDSFTAHWSR